jgi:hypothetical protein
MIIVTANVGLLPFEIGKKRAYITDMIVNIRLRPAKLCVADCVANCKDAETKSGPGWREAYGSPSRH